MTSHEVVGLSWDGDRLIITTVYPFQNPKDQTWHACDVTQTIWLQPAPALPLAATKRAQPRIFTDLARINSRSISISSIEAINVKGQRARSRAENHFELCNARFSFCNLESALTGVYLRPNILI